MRRNTISLSLTHTQLSEESDACSCFSSGLRPSQGKALIKKIFLFGSIMNSKVKGVSPMADKKCVGADHQGSMNPKELEIRPGGMLVQKRDSSSSNSNQTSTIKVRVKYGSTYHDISISCQASFGNSSSLLTTQRDHICFVRYSRSNSLGKRLWLLLLSSLCIYSVC